MSNQVNGGPGIGASSMNLPSSSWFRFGLPLGSAVIMVAFLDTAMNFFSAWMDMGGIILYHTYSDVTMDPITIIWILIVIVWITANLILLWYGVVLRANVNCLKAWITTTLICTVIVLCIWFYVLNMYFGVWKEFFAECYSLTTFLISNTYIIYVAIQCLIAMKQNEPLDPIGKGAQHILKFYKDDPTLAAKFLLISELVFIGEYIFTRQVLQSLFDRVGAGHEGDESLPIILEEYVLRILRFIITSVGVYIIVSGKLPALRYWGILYGGTILASVCIFLYLLVGWEADHALYTVGYYMVFLANIIYRSFILFVCMKVAQPYMQTGSFLTLTNEA